MQSNIIYFYIF